jgi:hypothetical protein
MVAVGDTAAVTAARKKAMTSEMRVMETETPEIRESCSAFRAPAAASREGHWAEGDGRV